jgi:hypothetical protein
MAHPARTVDVSPGPAGKLGGSAPNPRSLSLWRTPAQTQEQRGCPGKPKQPRAVRPVPDRSGRTPAEPYPVQSAPQLTTESRRRPLRRLPAAKIPH